MPHRHDLAMTLARCSAACKRGGPSQRLFRRAGRFGKAGGMKALLGQFSRFFRVGLAAAVVHYGLLVGLVELAKAQPVPATLAGYVAGGLVSYGLNRLLTYESRRGHADAGWRFAVVAGAGFLCTWGLMQLFVERLGLPYLPAQLVTTGIVLVWSFFAHKLFTFGESLRS